MNDSMTEAERATRDYWNAVIASELEEDRRYRRRRKMLEGILLGATCVVQAAGLGIGIAAVLTGDWAGIVLVLFFGIAIVHNTRFCLDVLRNGR